MNRFLGTKDVINLVYECPQIFLGINKAIHNPTLFYSSLMVNGLILRNCMLDYGASNNIITLEVMHELGLQITRPYRNVQAVDAREVSCQGFTALFTCSSSENVSDGCACYQLSYTMGHAPFEIVGCGCRGFHSDGSITCQHSYFPS